MIPSRHFLPRSCRRSTEPKHLPPIRYCRISDKPLMRKVISITLCTLCLSSGLVMASDVPPQGSALDQGLWWLYHLQYDKALADFNVYIANHPQDPAGYFYRTATDWWHLAQEFEYNLPDIQLQFEEDAEKTIEV